MYRRNWTREELLLAFNLYCKLPFGKYHSRNKSVIELASLIRRTPDSVALKLTNFASFDSFHQKRGVRGMEHTSKLDRQVWDEFTSNWDDLIFESERVLAQYRGRDIHPDTVDVGTLADRQGEDRIREVKTRVNQAFFRRVILVNYGAQCAICHLNIPEFLVAGHIIPWSKDPRERLNPENGICLCTLHDVAFDRGYVAVDKKRTIVLSTELQKRHNEGYYQAYFGMFERKRLLLPSKFLPRPEFLDYHFKEIFLG